MISREVVLTSLMALALITVFGLPPLLALKSTETEADLYSEVESYISMGKKHQDAGRLRKAAEMFRHALEIDPENVEALKRLAEIYERMGELRDAVLIHLKLAKLSPKEKAHRYAAVSRLYLKEPFDEEGYPRYQRCLMDLEVALQYGRRAVEADPSSPEGYQAIAEAYEKIGTYEKAASLWEKVVELASENGLQEEYQLAWHRLAKAYYRTGRYDLAEELWQRALRTVDDREIRRRMLYYLSSLLYQRKKLGDLIERYETILRRNPMDEDALFDLSQLYFHQGEHLRAIELYEKTVELEPDDVKLYRDMIRLYRQLPRVTGDERYEAILRKELAAWKELYRLAPQEVEMGRVSWLYTRLGRHEERLKFLRQAIASEPENVRLYLYIGGGYNQLGMRSEAEDSYRKALEIAERQGDILTQLYAYQRLAWLYKEMGDEDRALEAVSAMGRLDSGGDAALEVGLAGEVVQTYRTLGREDLAAEWIRKWVASHPDRAEAYVCAAWLYGLIGSDRESAETMKQAIKLARTSYERYFYRSWLASAYRRMGEIELAKTLLEEMSQQPVPPSWRERVKKRLRELEVEEEVKLTPQAPRAKERRPLPPER